MQTSQVASFLDSLWGRKDEERGFIEIFSGVHKEGRLEDRRGRHFKTVDGAAKEVDRLLAAPVAREIYVCVSLANQQLGKDRRISVGDSVGIAGLFADVDFAGDGHAKKTYPPDEAAARKVLEATGLKPTLLVHSGGGLQAWWLGEEVAYFDSQEEKTRWIRLARGWVETLATHAKSMGWALDPAKDLARLLRVAGTFNNKGAPPRQVTVVEEGPRYGDWSAFEALIDWPKQEAQAVMVEGIILDPQAEPRADLFFALSENDRKFKKSWKHERPDLVDQSASAYDMSLAMHAVGAGWTDQDVVNLLVAHRRLYGEDLKLREDYYKRTIGRARATCRGGEGEAMRIELGIDGSSPMAGPEIFVEISKQLGLDGEHSIVRVMELSGDPPSYRLYTVGGATISLGEIGGILDQARFRASVACTTRRLTRSLKKPAWDVLVQAILDNLEILDLGDGHPLKRFQSQIEEYLEKNIPVKGEEWKEAAQEHKPFVHEDKVWLSVKSLVRFCLRTQADRVSDRAVAASLGISAWEHRKFTFRVEGQPVGRWCWGKAMPG